MSVPFGNLGDALTTFINAQTWTQTFTAVKRYAPIFDKLQLKDLRCVVIPHTAEIKEIDYGEMNLWDISFVIVLEKSVLSNNTTEVDTLTNFCFEMFDKIRNEDLTTIPAQFTSAEILSVFDDERLADGLFLSAIKINYNVEVQK